MIAQDQLAKDARVLAGIGLLLVLVVMFARGGVLGLVDDALARLKTGTRLALETRALAKSFGALTVAERIDFRLRAGARHALIGPNGAGKTSFVNLVTGGLRRAGQILLAGHDVTGLSGGGGSNAVGRTFQINTLFAGLSVLENVLLAVGERHGLAGDMFRLAGSRRAVVEEAFALLGG